MGQPGTFTERLSVDYVLGSPLFKAIAVYAPRLGDTQEARADLALVLNVTAENAADAAWRADSVTINGAVENSGIFKHQQCFSDTGPCNIGMRMST